MVNAKSKQIMSSALYDKSVLLNGLRLLWVGVVFWCECGSFLKSIYSCRWPDKLLRQPLGSPKPTHILLIADAQVRHPTISTVTLSWTAFFKRLMFDITLRKNWKAANLMSPQTVIFLGDMLATGRLLMSEEEYEQYYERFRSFFPLDPSIPAYYIPGNNDVGLGVSSSFHKNARRRFLKHFGAFNQQTTIRNHTFVFLDAPGLVEEDYQRATRGQAYDVWTPIPHGPVEFVQSLPVDSQQDLILFTHIPLFRPDGKSCGPLREKGTIRRGVGHGYQNTLGKQTTLFLIEVLRPAAVFSADDRDYCEYVHAVPVPDPQSSTNTTRVREVTVKSFSPARNIRKPGFHLLSLGDPYNDPVDSTAASARATFADSPCLLPDLAANYTSIYAPCLILTLIILFLHNYLRKRRAHGKLSLSFVSLSPYTCGYPSLGVNDGVSPSTSALWSPFVPFTPSSARPAAAGNIPQSAFRITSNTGSAPVLRTASHSASSVPGSPLLSPLFDHDPTDDHDHDGGATLSIPQYATRHYTHAPWPNGEVFDEQEQDHALDGDASLLPTPPVKKSNKWRWQWSWTFVLRGRRRRISIPIPSPNSILSALLNGFQVRQSGKLSTRRKQGVVSAVLMDLLMIMAPVAAVWMLITWWLF